MAALSFSVARSCGRLAGLAVRVGGLRQQCGLRQLLVAEIARGHRLHFLRRDGAQLRHHTRVSVQRETVEPIATKLSGLAENSIELEGF